MISYSNPYQEKSRVPHPRGQKMFRRSLSFSIMDGQQDVNSKQLTRQDAEKLVMPFLMFLVFVSFLPSTATSSKKDRRRTSRTCAFDACVVVSML